METEVGDCSLWHYLIFCEEFVSDDWKNDFICRVCQESVRGHPAFKCLECGFLQHKSCSQLPDLTEMDFKHDLKERHHLILREETENNGKEEAVCRGCGKLVSGPTYRCSVPLCTFHLHKSCDQLSHAIQHIRHPDHTLLLRLPSSTASCYLCGKYRKKPLLLYGCRICNFDVDIKCVSRWDILESERKMEVGDCSKWHYLIFCEEFMSDDYRKDVICWVCEESVSGYPAFKCLECSFVQHKSCTQLPDSIKMNVRHYLASRHHLILREETENNGKMKVVCAGCGKLTSSPAYRCSIPRCIFHLHKSCDELSHAIQHNAHPNHTLFLSLSRSYSCDVCHKDREKRTILHYHCCLCKIHMDNKCASRWDIIESERKMEVGDCSIWHYLIFCKEFVSDDYMNNVVCWVCEEPVSGHLTFKCLECSFVQHKSCTQLPKLTKTNRWHDIRDRHHLILREQMEDDSKKKVVCAGCGKLTSGPTFRCSIPHCAFHLHKSCDQLSHAILHNAHPDHTLILALSQFSFYCNLCRRHRKKKTILNYHCHLCYFAMDNKCASGWEIIESERKMEDYSIWHCLILCEEFVSDDYKNDIACWVCEESVLGHPTFKCLECSFVQHKTCSQLPDLTEMDVKHDIKDKHHLILREETQNNAKKEVVCVGCREVASGPTYRCSIPECAFYLHQSCCQLSRAIQNTAHPEHILILRPPPFNTHCGICGEDRHKEATLLYTCRLCKFEMDYKCASSVKVIDNDNCDQHALILCQKLIPFMCNACGVKAKDVASQCCHCGVLTHPMCAHFPQTIKIKSHLHLLFRTYCLRRVTKLEEEVCKLCCKKVNTKYGGYYCQPCDYIVHMRCAKLNQDKSITYSEEDYRRHLVYLIEGLDVEEDKAVDVPPTVKHSNHPEHELILSFEDSGNDRQLYKNGKRCEVCMQFIISSSFYSCEDCNIFVHKRCAQLPKTVRRPLFDENSFTLSSHPRSSTDNLFVCQECQIYRHGLFYKSGHKKIDVQCFLIPETISHKSHEHLLHVPILKNPRLKAICIGCGEKNSRWRRYVMCSDCEFWLCFKCATLPLVAIYRYHPHLLKLTYTWEDNLEEYYCLICEEKLDPEHWFYSCENCEFPTHIQCVIGSSLKSERHQHPVTLVRKRKYSLKCHLCEKGFRDFESVLECPQCKFNFHFKCYY